MTDVFEYDRQTAFATVLWFANGRRTYEEHAVCSRTSKLWGWYLALSSVALIRERRRQLWRKGAKVAVLIDAVPLI